MAKQRVSLTLEEGIVEKLDRESEREDVNRSRLVENILENYFRRKEVETAVIFCGDPENETLNLREGKPVLSHILDHLADSRISRVFLLAGQNSSEIESNYGSRYRDMALEYVSEEEPRGTAAALQIIEDRIDGTFVALNGHVITDVDLQEMLEVHREEGNPATVALTTVEEPSRYGVARLKGRKILGFVEKPEPGEEPSRLINAGTYIFDPEIFSRLQGNDIENVFKQLASAGDLTGYIYGGEWIDIEEY